MVFFKDSILMVRPSYAHRLWTIPGGGVGFRESHCEAAHRELYEELRVNTDLNYFGQYFQKIEYKNDTVECFYGHVVNQNFVIDNAEIEEAGWYTLDNLPRDRTPSVDRILKLYSDYENGRD